MKVNNLQDILDLLGYPVKDKVTNFEGVIDSISIDLYGCAQAVVAPSVDSEGKRRDGQWFDVARLEKTSKIRVMEPIPLRYPLDPGPADKPIP